MRKPINAIQDQLLNNQVGKLKIIPTKRHQNPIKLLIALAPIPIQPPIPPKIAPPKASIHK